MFQSHYGAIATYGLIPEFSRSVGFNPTMVRLRPSLEACECVGGVSFNPTMVRLRLMALSAKGTETDGFNPTMVRLRHVVDRENPRHRRWFQSHYGAIATCLPSAARDIYAMFQSHYGAIATTQNQH